MRRFLPEIVFAPKWRRDEIHRRCCPNSSCMPHGMTAITPIRSKATRASASKTKVPDEVTPRRTPVNNGDRRKFNSEPVKGELVYGIHPVILALEAGRRTPHRLYLKDQRLENPTDNVARIMDLCYKLKLPIHKRDADWISMQSGTDMHQGVCLDCSMLSLRIFGKFLFSYSACAKFTSDGFTPVSVIVTADRSAVPQNSRDDFWLLLDGIEDPMNLGALLRSAHFFGIKNVVVTQANASPFTALVNKVSCGAVELLNLFTLPPAQVEKTLRHLSHKKFSLVASLSKSELSERRDIIPDVDTVPDIYSFRWTGNTMLIMGNESRGISNEILKHCDHLVNIASPLESDASMDEKSQLQVGSLNVSACGAVALYQIAARRAVALARQKSKRAAIDRSAVEAELGPVDVALENSTVNSSEKMEDDVYEEKQRMERFS